MIINNIDNLERSNVHRSTYDHGNRTDSEEGSQYRTRNNWLDPSFVQKIQKENDFLRRRVTELEEKHKKIMSTLTSKTKLQHEDVHSLYQFFYIDEFKREVKFILFKVLRSDKRAPADGAHNANQEQQSKGKS